MLQLVGLEAHLVQYAECHLGGDALKVFLARGNDEACHVECSRRYDKLVATLGKIAVGTMLFAGEHHRVVVGIVSPAYYVQHGFWLAFGQWQCLVEADKQLLVAILRLAVDEQCGAGILFDERDALFVVKIQYGLEVAR